MTKDQDEKNKEKLILMYESIPDSNKNLFMKAVKYLIDCFK